MGLSVFAPPGVGTEIGGALETFGLAPNTLNIEPVNVPAAILILNYLSIELSGRALPYQPARWSVRQRVKTTYYQGNPVATQQVLGPEEMPSVWRGMWKDRFLGSAGKAKRLVDQCQNLCRSGLLCKVTWGPETRFGTLTEFHADYDRRQDIAWEMRWEWSGRDQSLIAAIANALFNAVDQVTSFIDGIAALVEAIQNIQAVLTTIKDQLVGPLKQLQDSATRLKDAFDRNLATQEIGTADAVEALNLSSETKKELLSMKAILDAVDDTDDLPSSPIAPTQGEASVRVNALRDAALVQIRALLALLLAFDQFFLPASGVTEKQGIATARDGETLRDVALRTTGSADNWKSIAEANRLANSSVSAGQVLTIPRIR